MVCVLYIVVAKLTYVQSSIYDVTYGGPFVVSTVRYIFSILLWNIAASLAICNKINAKQNFSCDEEFTYQIFHIYCDFVNLANSTILCYSIIIIRVVEFNVYYQLMINILFCFVTCCLMCISVRDGSGGQYRTLRNVKIKNLTTFLDEGTFASGHLISASCSASLLAKTYSFYLIPSLTRYLIDTISTDAMLAYANYRQFS